MLHSKLLVGSSRTQVIQSGLGALSVNKGSNHSGTPAGILLLNRVDVAELVPLEENSSPQKGHFLRVYAAMPRLDEDLAAMLYLRLGRSSLTGRRSQRGDPGCPS